MLSKISTEVIRSKWRRKKLKTKHAIDKLFYTGKNRELRLTENNSETWRTNLRSHPRGQRKRTKRKPSSERKMKLLTWEGDNITSIVTQDKKKMKTHFTKYKQNMRNTSNNQGYNAKIFNLKITGPVASKGL